MQWLNAAAVSQNTTERLESLHKTQEVLLHKIPQHLAQFIPDVMNFTTDKNQDVRKALVGFIEEIWFVLSTYTIKQYSLVFQSAKNTWN